MLTSKFHFNHVRLIDKHIKMNCENTQICIDFVHKMHILETIFGPTCIAVQKVT